MSTRSDGEWTVAGALMLAVMTVVMRCRWSWLVLRWIGSLWLTEGRAWPIRDSTPLSTARSWGPTPASRWSTSTPGSWTIGVSWVEFVLDPKCPLWGLKNVPRDHTPPSQQGILIYHHGTGILGGPLRGRWLLRPGGEGEGALLSGQALGKQKERRVWVVIRGR